MALGVLCVVVLFGDLIRCSIGLYKSNVRGRTLSGHVSHLEKTMMLRADQVRIASVGDSLTAASYPSQLQAMLGSHYLVMNFGEAGNEMQRHVHASYWESTKFKQALDSAPDIVLIMLGTNDARFGHWLNDGRTYVADYVAMIEKFKALPSTPTIYTMIPPPQIKYHKVYNQTVVNHVLPSLIWQINQEADLPYEPIDIFSSLGGVDDVSHPEWFNFDGIHLSSDGYEQIALTVAHTLCPDTLSTAPSAKESAKEHWWWWWW